MKPESGTECIAEDMRQQTERFRLRMTERERRFKALVEQGATPIQIRRQLGCNPYYLAKRLGVTFRPRED